MSVLLPCVTEESYRSGKKFLDTLEIVLNLLNICREIFLERDSKGLAASGAHKQM